MSFSQFGSTITGISKGFFEQQMPKTVQCGRKFEDVVAFVKKSYTDME